MSEIDKIKEQYEIGQATFKQLFELNDTELRSKLIEILEDHHIDVLNHNCDCIRTIKNEKPEKIEFWFYEAIKVDWTGISIKPEHGNFHNIIKFNKFFHLKI